MAGQIQRELIGVNRGVLHEVNDQLDTIRPVTKWAARVLHPAEIPAVVHEAFFQLRTGRPRPVEIEIPPETLAQESEIELLEPAQAQCSTASSESLQRGGEIVAGASNVLIWAGGGVISSEASEALQRLAEHLQAPVVTTSEGKGAISDRHPLSAGFLRFRDDPMAAMAPKYDVVVAVGTRLANPELLDGRQVVVQIDVDEEEIGRNYSNTFGIAGDARSSLELLLELVSAAGPPRPGHSEEVADIRAGTRRAPQLLVEPQDSFTKAIRAAIPDDGIVVCGMTQVGYYSRVHYPVYQPRTFLTSSYFGNLGFAYPVALRAKVAWPDAAVVAISGDGGFLFNSQELATAVKYSINVVAVVFNDGAFGNVLRDQANQFEGRTIGAELHNPDFVRLAEAYGARGVRAEGPEALESALRDALDAGAPTVIDVPVEMMPLPY